MEDLLQSQIRESCKLAMPVGLKELMSDISREVLRSQPENLYQFIANYLEALLYTRETLSIACRICGEVSNCSCEPQLDDELYRIGLSREDVTVAKNIIMKHFDKGQVQESSLLIELAAKSTSTKIPVTQLHKIIGEAIRQYIVKRKEPPVLSNIEEVSTQTTTSSVSAQSSISDFYKPTFSPDVLSEQQETQDNQFYSSRSYPPFNPSVSATTLAGSYVDLPQRIPYSAHTSECDNILLKSEKSVLNLLKTLIFTEDREHHVNTTRRNIGTYRSIGSVASRSTDSEEMDDAIRSIFSQDIYEIRSRTSKESDGRLMFQAIQENLNESSSGGS